ADDAIGGNNGTLQNGTTFAPGRFGQAFSLDGVDDSVAIPDAPTLDGMAQLTVEGWVKFNALPPGKFQWVVSKGELAGPGTNSFNIFADSGRLFGIVETPAGAWSVGSLRAIAGSTAFHHVAL